MQEGARSPEELETLLEDALVIRGETDLVDLFCDGALLLAGDGRQARDSRSIVALALSIWAGDRAYVAGPARVVQARDIAVSVVDGGVNVMRRGADGIWRFVIVWTMGAREEQ
jgi:hypothetical protein